MLIPHCDAVAVGRPIHVQKCEKPTLEEVTHIQQQYIEELMRCVALSIRLVRRKSVEVTLLILRRIWNTYKDEFAQTRTRELSIIE